MKTSKAKDFFINLGAVVSLYVLVISLINLLFTVINAAYPQVTAYDVYSYTGSISWPVATLIIFSPIFIALMWLLGKQYESDPESRNSGVHRWLTYVTLFIAALSLAGDLITVLYYFLDGQELTTAFLMKVAVVLVITGCVFAYYLSDILNKLTSQSRLVWRIIAILLVAGSIIWGFSVLGSPITQRLLKYDEQKVNALQNIKYEIESYYSSHKALPVSLDALSQGDYVVVENDTQTNMPFEYSTTGKDSYTLCATFNKPTPNVKGPNMYARPIGYMSFVHDAGHYCFNLNIPPQAVNPVPGK